MANTPCILQLIFDRVKCREMSPTVDPDLRGHGRVFWEYSCVGLTWNSPFGSASSTQIGTSLSQIGKIAKLTSISHYTNRPAILAATCEPVLVGGFNNPEKNSQTVKLDCYPYVMENACGWNHQPLSGWVPPVTMVVNSHQNDYYQPRLAVTRPPARSAHLHACDWQTPPVPHWPSRTATPPSRTATPHGAHGGPGRPWLEATRAAACRKQRRENIAKFEKLEPKAVLF